ncbi:MAG: hypothetical protein E7262_09405 [Lachnospiraceae bacterium]|nr:hypothetical protein [Lachnospiraceae bacterium]
MAGFWRDFAGGFSQNSKEDTNSVIEHEFDGNAQSSIKKEYVRDENLIVGNEAEDKHGDVAPVVKEVKEKATEEPKEIKKYRKDGTLITNETKKDDESVIEEDKKKGQVEEEMELNNRTIITKSTIIAGNISTEDDLIIEGSVCGDVDCKGKLTISGEVSGNAIAKSISINTSKFEGDVRSDGRIEIKEGTVIIGNIYGDEALISGAVKGEIVVANGARLEKSAIVKGNIKAKSVQIDNGAVLQGFCELQYDNLDLDELFGVEEEEEEEEYNTSGMTYKDMVANMEEEEGAVSLEEEFEKELAAKEALEATQAAQEQVEEDIEPAKVPEMIEIQQQEPVELQVEEKEEVAENPEEVREAYMQEMEDNYSNFMDQLQMDAES